VSVLLQLRLLTPPEKHRGACTTSLKVAGLIHDAIVGISYRHIPLARGLTQSRREMSTGNASWRVKAASS